MPLRRADDILAWLLARQPDKRIVEKTTGLPYGWGLWLRALNPLPYSARAAEMVAQLMQRPLPGSPGRLPALSLPQALRRLAWQTWDPAPRDQRWMRWTSAAISVLLHVMFALLLVWVAVIRPPVEPEQGGDGGRMRVDFIGQGTPADAGGGQPRDAAAAQPNNAVAARPNVERGSAPLNETNPPQPADVPPTASRAEPGSTPSEPSPPTPARAEPTPPTPAEPVPPTPVATTLPPEPTPAPGPQPTPPAPAPAVEQPIQATDVAEATTDFVVPPTTVPRTEVRVVPREAPQVTVRERTVTTVEAPQVAPATPQLRPIEPQLRPREVTVREREVTVVTAPTPAVPVAMPRVDVTLPQREVQVREREVPSAPVVDVTIPQLPSREVTVRPPTRSPEVAVRERTIPNAPSRPVQAATPTPAPSTTPASASSTTREPAVVERGSAPLPAAPQPSSSRAEPGSTSTSPAASSQSSASARSPASSAPAARPAPNPGDWSTPARGDDWGAASRNAPGSTDQANQGTGRTGDGLFNADGSVRVPNQDGSGNSERGAPGGENDGWSRERIAQSGTWLKRPPYDYTPTSFDKYWAPNESLLAEWVRRGIKSMEIPIPGTSSRISCVISVLQFGGGCGLTDPNMQDQPAVARPPPDIPFKKELQEDNGSR